MNLRAVRQEPNCDLQIRFRGPDSDCSIETALKQLDSDGSGEIDLVEFSTVRHARRVCSILVDRAAVFWD